MGRRFSSVAGWAAVALAAVWLAAPAVGAQQDDEGFGPEYDAGDPWERMNRGIFSFNEWIDRNALEPVAVAWDWVLPDPVQTGISNVFDNFRFPTIFINNILQGKPLQAAEDVGRFLINTTAGFGGLLDPAREAGLPGNDEDFGQTFGKWGIPTGPYVVVPLLGPSNPRDLVGLAADSASRVWPWFSVWYITASITTGNLLNRRSMLIEEIRSNRESSFDYYAFVRNAYLSYRENKVRDQEDSAEELPDDLYYFEEEEEAGGT